MLTYPTAEVLAKTLKADQGFTVSGITGESITHQDGYLVGGLVQEWIIPLDDQAAEKIFLFAWNYVSDLILPERWLGAWVDAETGLVHLDVSEWRWGLLDAVRVGRQRQEKALWSLEESAEIRL